MPPQKNGTTYTPKQRMTLARQAIEMHRGGLSWDKIAAQIGVTRVTLRKWVAKFQKEFPIVPVEELQQLDEFDQRELHQLERIAIVYTRILEKIEDIVKAPNGVDKDQATAVNTLASSLDRIAQGIIDIGGKIKLRRAKQVVNDNTKRLKRIREAQQRQYAAADAEEVAGKAG